MKKGWGTTSRFLRCLGDRYREKKLGVGDHFQVLRVSVWTCTGKYFRGGGPLPGPQGVRKDMYRKNVFSDGGPLPAPQGVRRDMYLTVLRTYLPTYYQARTY